MGFLSNAQLPTRVELEACEAMCLFQGYSCQSLSPDHPTFLWILGIQLLPLPARSIARAANLASQCLPSSLNSADALALSV